MASSLSLVQLVYYVVPVATAITTVVLAAWVYRSVWSKTGADWFVATLLCGGAWNALLFVTTAAGSPVVQRLSLYGRAVASTWCIAAFVVFCSVYTGRNFHRRLPFAAALGAVSVAVPVLAVTAPWHGLLYYGFVIRTDPFTYMLGGPGVGYVAVLIVLLPLSLYGTYALVHHLLSTAGRASGQLVLLLVGVLSIAAFEAAGGIGVFPATGLSHSGYAVGIFLLCTFLALFRFDLLEVQPVARNAVVENLRDPVLVVDDHGRVVDFNPAATHVWPDLGVHVPATLETACPALAEAVSVPPATTDVTEQLSLTYDGQDRHYSVTVSAVSQGSDGPDGWHSILLRDITELEQSRWQLERQNDRLDQVAATISHDLRNPINVIDGNVELADARLERPDVDADLRETVGEYLGNVDGASGRMQDIIDDILTIAREGKTVEETEPVSLEAVAADAWETVDTADATLTVTGDRTFRADRSKLLTIFENLFRNALDHGPADVAVTVRPTDGGFAVADDGPGIPADHRDHVFEYGYTTADGGTGLGLSIVRTMAESHGWTVDLDADHDDGARFVFAGVDAEGLGSRDVTGTLTQ
ncbi:ATP-binding protein [Halorientalis halophila]|uniref:sensor histidine kinase n=1 Tax=Halorientalis halophila TaxID=3108499 RepID=UPI00300AD982